MCNLKQLLPYLNKDTIRVIALLVRMLNRNSVKNAYKMSLISIPVVDASYQLRVLQSCGVLKQAEKSMFPSAPTVCCYLQ